MVKQRPCLKCHKDFTSEGAHNRVCAKCNRENQSVQVPRIVIVGGDMGERLARKRLGVA